MAVDWPQTVSAVCDLAVRAGEAILAVAGHMRDPDHKSDGSPVTEADLASHRLIVDGLAVLTPEIPILSEESAERLDDLRGTDGRPPSRYWCVDPLDGTKEFIRGIGEYTVNIALVDGGRPLTGVVYLPATGLLFGATPARGAWLQDCTQNANSACVALPRVHKTAQAPLTAVASRSHPSAATDDFLRRYGITEVLRRGSSLKICAVAEGRADVYPRFGPTCFWDTAAGIAVALAAGCQAVTSDGKPLNYALGGSIKHQGFIIYRSERLTL